MNSPNCVGTNIKIEIKGMYLLLYKLWKPLAFRCQGQIATKFERSKTLSSSDIVNFMGVNSTNTFDDAEFISKRSMCKIRVNVQDPSQQRVMT
jgi:hypothetical protein